MNERGTVKPQIVSAVIGWSNWRTGCEFYEDTERHGEGYARWLPRMIYDPEKQPHGRLLTDLLNDPEGATAIVVVLPGRRADPSEAMTKIAALFEEADQ